MLPESKNLPALFFQKRVDRYIAGAILLELPIPEVGVGLRTNPVIGAAVPLTAVDENGNSCRVKHEIRVAFHPGLDTVSEPHSPQCMTQENLRLRVTSPDARHAQLPLLRCQDIGPPFTGRGPARSAQVYSSSGPGADSAKAGPNFRDEMSTETLSAWTPFESWARLFRTAEAKAPTFLEMRRLETMIGFDLGAG